MGFSTEIEPPTDPAVVLVYGPSGLGKTTDTGYSFPNALFVAAPGALECVRTTCGYKPKHVVSFETLAEATAFLQNAKKKFTEIVFDDFSFLSQTTMRSILGSRTEMQLKDWGTLKNQVIDFRNAARKAGAHVIINAWEKAPAVKNGTSVRGGPDLSGRLPEELPTLADLVVRAIYKPEARPWKAAYRCELTPDYVMKDRFNIAIKCSPCPMNLGEILRATGYTGAHPYAIKRLPEIADWQETTVEEIAQALLEAEPKQRQQFVDHYYTELVNNQQIPPKLAAWTVRDASDRCAIRTALDVSSQKFYA